MTGEHHARITDYVASAVFVAATLWASLLLIVVLCSGCTPAPSVRFVAQRDSTDCGQACLTMLGYDGYGRDWLLTSPDILSRACGVREIVPGSERPDREPHMLVLEWPNGKQHWVVAYRDSVYDPASGGTKAGALHGRVAVREFVVPFAKEKP